MNWLRNFMMGRNGVDQLSIALLILSFIISLIGGLASLSILVYVSYIPLILSFFRILSRNIDKRRMENYKFAMIMSPAYAWLKKTQNRALSARTHKIFKCPNCKSKLRVPKGKGQIIVTCPKCRTEFRKKA